MLVKCIPQFKAANKRKKYSLNGKCDPKGGFKYFVAYYHQDAFKANHDKHCNKMTETYKACRKKSQKSILQLGWLVMNFM